MVPAAERDAVAVTLKTHQVDQDIRFGETGGEVAARSGDISRPGNGSLVVGLDLVAPRKAHARKGVCSVHIHQVIGEDARYVKDGDAVRGNARILDERAEQAPQQNRVGIREVLLARMAISNAPEPFMLQLMAQSFVVHTHDFPDNHRSTVSLLTVEASKPTVGRVGGSSHITMTVPAKWSNRVLDKEIEMGNGKKSFGETIAVLRKEQGITQLQLAEQMGVTDKAVSKWERNLSMPDVASIPRLAEALGVTTDELLQVKAAANGNGLSDKVAETIDLASYAFVSFLYGSIASLNYCRVLIAHALLDYAKIYLDGSLAFEGIKLLVLAGEAREFSVQFNARSGEVSNAIKAGADDLWALSEKTVDDLTPRIRCALVRQVSPYFSDETFCEVEQYLTQDDQAVFRECRYEWMNSINAIKLRMETERFWRTCSS